MDPMTCMSYMKIFLLLLHPKPLMIYFLLFSMFKEGEHKCNIHRKGNGWF